MSNIRSHIESLDSQIIVHENFEVLEIEQSPELSGTVELIGAKNAVLVIIASLVLTEGKSVLKNVPCSDDVFQMIQLLSDLGAEVKFDQSKNTLIVDTTFLRSYRVKSSIMKKMRASILVMGPLLARFGKAEIALPGGCLIGARPIDLHLKNLQKMGVEFTTDNELLTATVSTLQSQRLVLAYQSVGATEQLLMAAVTAQGITTIINAALEPEVLDLIDVLKKMGALIDIQAPATLIIKGVTSLKSVEHEVMLDRLEAGSLLLAAAITGGSISIPQARADMLDVFLEKLKEMGHRIDVGPDYTGITIRAIKNPQAVSFTTAPYPGFPTDLQAPMMAALCCASGQSVIHEAVFENRLLHVRELQKMGAQITVDGDKAIIKGVENLYGASVIATDIRSSCALALAGLRAHGKTVMSGLNHWKRGYEGLERKLMHLGARIALKTSDKVS